MTHGFLNSSWLSQALGTLVRSNGVRNNSHGSSFVTGLIIALLCGMIQPTNSSVVSSIYSSALSSSSARFSRLNGSTDQYYYKAIRITIFTAGTYTFTSNSSMDTYGYLYNDSFIPSYPSQNLITFDDDGNGAGQFKISLRLESGFAYFLIVTTYNKNTTGSFLITAVGPASVGPAWIIPSTNTPTTVTTTGSSVNPSTYLSILSSSSPIFSRPNGNTANYYYHAIQVTVYMTGTYNFTSVSSIDTYGYFYNATFDASYPSQRLITSDDDSAGNGQFQISLNLQSGYTYVLVVTTHGITITGIFSIRAVGPTLVTLTSFTPVTTIFSDILTSSSPSFSRPDTNTGYYYYQAIQVTVYTTGAYNFTSVSSIDTYGYFYNALFDVSYPSHNLIASNDESAGNGQFQIRLNLQSGYTYVLVVTTFNSRITGSFSIRAVGPASVGLRSITPTGTTTSSIISSTYSGMLYSGNPTFYRPNGIRSKYYYQAFHVTVYTTNFYIFVSSSSMDTYGCLYYDPFDPSNPSRNLILCDDDSAGNRQFQIAHLLQSGSRYILVVTTLSSGVTGSFSITASGSDSIYLTAFTPSTSNALKTIVIVSITFCGVVLFVGIVVVCTRRKNHQTAFTPTFVSPRSNQSIHQQNFPMTGINGNPTRVNMIHVPYTISTSTGPGTRQEELPPAYESIISSAPPQEQPKADRY